jgi:hypothetical protein
MKTPRSGIVPSFWKLIIQASFHGRGAFDRFDYPWQDNY